MVNKQRRYLFVNQTYVDLLGLPSADIVGKHVADVIGPLYEQVSPRLDRAFAGERVSYGLRYELGRDAVVATVPVGYADGYPRSTTGEVLIRGRRCRVAGTVTMDQVIVDCGDLEVAAGDEVVLLGHQGEEEVSAWELAASAGTVAYEIVSRIGPRVPRDHRG